ncbi:hypothetical protein RV11_GL003190 [Enterococcus phoeniculicola]|nr:hypothetical protein [Enterococcus phoeniculicola]OJG72219.1 hypothetical protein RV11_GL003190 [Enterococcus phoeniculicola]
MDNYEDRGMVKWAGFYLSEHTAALAEDRMAKLNKSRKKSKLSSQEISELLHHAQVHNKTIAIQREELDGEGNYPADIVGKIDGYDSLGIYISLTKIDYDEIRNVEIIHLEKWSQV